MKEPYDSPMRLSVHHPQVNPMLWWRSVGSTHTAYAMETLLDQVARATKQDPVAYRLRVYQLEPRCGSCYIEPPTTLGELRVRPEL